MFKFEKTVYKMIRILISVIFIILYSLRIVAQTGTSPAFVMLEEVLVTSADPRFAPLFYSTSESGEGSLAYELIELVKTGKIEVLRSDIVGGWKTSWDYIQHSLGKREKGQHIYGEIIDGKYFSGTLTKDIPYSLKNIQRYKLYYITFHDENYNLLSRDFVGLIPLNQYKQYTRTFYEPIAYFGLKEPMVSAILGKRCLQSSDSSMTYVNFLNHITTEELDPHIHLISLKAAIFLSDKFSFEKTDTTYFSFPEFVNSSACVVMKEISDIEYNDSTYYIYENNFDNISNKFVISQLKARSDANLAFFVGSETFGYIDFFTVSYKSIDQCNNVYKYDPDNFFSHQLDRSEIDISDYLCDTIESFDSCTGAQNPDTVVCTKGGAVLRILELRDGTIVYPIALCIGKTVTDKHFKHVEYKPILWIPLNQQFISILDDYQAYLPGYPQQLTLWGYLLSGMYKGTIISERPIDNAEWQQMLEILR